MKRRPAPSQQAIPELIGPAALDMIKVEKNLNYISFFSPSKSKKGKKNSHSSNPAIRVITYPSREVNGKTVVPKTTIKPDSQLGLPTTADRDKYMAFMKIVTDRKAKVGNIENPIGFTTYELLKHLGLTDAGYHYEEVNQFLERMVSTTIKSEYAVYFHGSKRYAKDIFHVFNRVVLTGQETPEGSVAQMNYVFLSDWQLENINANYTFPIDFHSYRALRRDIAKALFGHLHTWFYASRGRPIERKYVELCELLDIQRWPHLSKAIQVLRPGLDELIGIRYLESWELLRTADGSDFKLILSPGDRIVQITRPKLATVVSSNPVEDPEMQKIIEALVVRGVRESDARRVLLDIDTETQYIPDQIEWFDCQMQRMGSSIRNPPGFLITSIRQNWPVPADFETSRKQQLQRDIHNTREADPQQFADAQRKLRQLQLEEEYRVWVDKQVDESLLSYPETRVRKRLKTLRTEILARYPHVYSQGRTASDDCPALNHHALLEFRREIATQLNVLPFEQFRKEQQPALF